MAKRNTNPSPTETRRRRPMPTPEDRENQLIAMAYDAAEKRIREGTASPSEIVHFLRLGSTKERIEKEILERQKDLISAKTDALQSAKQTEEFYQRVIGAIQLYSGAEMDDSNV